MEWSDYFLFWQQETKAWIHNLSEMWYIVNTHFHSTLSCNNNKDGNDDPNMQMECSVT